MSNKFQKSSVQFSCSVISNYLQPHRLQHTSLPCPSPTPGACSNSSIESVMPSNHLILCHPLLFLPSIFPSIRVFSNESVPPIRWPKYWSLRFSISPSNEYSGLISFRIDWFDLLKLQGTLNSLLQYHSSKASIHHSAFFMVQLSHPCMTPGKTIALTIWTFVNKVMSMLFNIEHCAKYFYVLGFLFYCLSLSWTLIFNNFGCIITECLVILKVGMWFEDINTLDFYPRHSV